ncbi:unnamed protein product, partial [Ixodes persulcatus]
ISYFQEESVFNEGHPLLISTCGKQNSASGIFLLNSNQIEVLISPKATATFKTSGGILDFFVFLGPKPQSVVAQYQQLVGFPSLPSVRMLKDRALEVLLCFNTATRNSSFPFQQAVNALALRRKFEKQSVTVTPKIVIYDGNGTPYICYREGESYYHIDFTHPLGPLYWAEVLYVVQTTRDLISAGQLLLEQPKCARPPKLGLPCPADTEVGTWQKASSQSDELCGTARLHLSTYRDLKFAYPYLLAEMTHRSLATMTRSRPVLLSEATFVGQGKWSGYWDRRPTPSWRGLRRALAEMLLHNMYGIPVFGTNICGHLSRKTESNDELCSCWTALGVFFPVFQNSRLWKIEKTLAAMAIKLRQFLQPYMYTLLYKSSVKGDMVAKPTSFDRHNGQVTFSFAGLSGKTRRLRNLQNVTLLSAYFPRGYWYDMYNNKRIVSAGQTTFFPSPLSTTGLFARGGSIIPGERQRKRSNRT